MDRVELARRLGAAAMDGQRVSGATIVDESEPARFMAALARAVGGGGPVFIADPAWTAARRAEFEALVDEPAASSDLGWLMIPSGGTSGRLKLARHDEQTIGAAVRGFCAHCGLQRVNAIGVLPLHHVGGLMAWLRCALTGGTFQSVSWKQLEAGETPALPGEDCVLSLVPTQLQRLLGSAVTRAWLQRFRAIFVSGGPIWPELAEAACAAELPVALSYGMTETAAMVTALRPEEFRAGLRSCGGPLPHARVSLAPDGTIAVGGESLFRGYWPDWRAAGDFATEDLGSIDERGHLRVHGRRDAVIITGGKKVQPAEVEAALRASGQFRDVAVIGVPDAEWGEAVVACYSPGANAPDLTRAAAALAPHQRPKRFLAVTPWPRNAQGKVDRAALRAFVVERVG